MSERVPVLSTVGGKLLGNIIGTILTLIFNLWIGTASMSYIWVTVNGYAPSTLPLVFWGFLLSAVWLPEAIFIWFVRLFS